MIKRKVLEYIRKHQLMSVDNLVLVAVSGGADSVALLRILLEMGCSCLVAHCNFQLRGKESFRDEHFVRDLCEQLGVPCRVATFDTYQYACEHKQSIEMAARELRYVFFHQLMDEYGIDVVAVAHHRGDQAETVLLNLLRGSGISGLRGMKPVNGKVIRPLLCCTKKEILRYLEQIKQPYVSDSSNYTDEPRRNKVRLQIMPLLQTINPQAEEAILRSASYLAQVGGLLNQVLNDDLQKYKLGENKYQRVMMQLPHGELLLHKWLNKYGFNVFQLEQIFECSLSNSTGRRFDTVSHTLWVDRDCLICEEKHERAEMPMLKMELFSSDEISLIADSTIAFLDADRFCLPLKQRHVEKGDRFVPLGMKGSKLVSDFMTDCKCSLLEKMQQTVLVDANGYIVWLIGRRIDDRFKWTKDTKKIMKITML